ncbi:MAG TPA: SRPBCC family protein, partial [Ilumatobacteraceae bacterium]
ASGDTSHMDLSADVSAPCSTDELFGWVDDLGRYPSWMGLVHRAEPTAERDGMPRWNVELRARMGPFARSKRLVMARTSCVPGESVVFERDELDGRTHSVWRLAAAVTADTRDTSKPQRSRLVMTLHYGGGLWTGGVVERALHDEIDRSRDRLLRLVAATTR